MEKGYTVQQAAQMLGVSVKTVRKRIAAGELRADLLPGPRGPQYTVWLEEEDTLDSRKGRVPATLQAPADPRIEALAALPAQVDAIGDRLRIMAETHATMTADLASSLETVLDCVKEQAAEIRALRAELEQAKRPWWKRRKK